MVIKDGMGDWLISDTLKFAESQLPELLYKQKCLTLKNYGIPDDAEVCTEGTTYVTWPSQFKVGGITVIDMKKVPKPGTKLGNETDTKYLGIYHGAEYVPSRGLSPRRHAKMDSDMTFSKFPLESVPGKDELVDLAGEKAKYDLVY